MISSKSSFNGDLEVETEEGEEEKAQIGAKAAGDRENPSAIRDGRSS